MKYVIYEMVAIFPGGGGGGGGGGLRENKIGSSHIISNGPIRGKLSENATKTNDTRFTEGDQYRNSWTTTRTIT